MNEGSVDQGPEDPKQSAITSDGLAAMAILVLTVALIIFVVSSLV